MIGFALLVAGATLVAGILGALALRLPRTIHARLVGLALVAGILPLAAVLLSGVAMFHMGADVVILAVAAASSTAGIGAALLTTRTITRPLRQLRRSARQVAGGDFGARVDPCGPNELAEVGTAFNDMAARLESLFDARRELVAWASHDLRTPLTALQSTLEAAEDGLVGPEQYLLAMRENVRALRVLVDDLFELARIDEGTTRLDLRDVDVASIVQACVNGLKSEALARRIRLEAKLGRGLPEVRGAPDKVERVLLNLLANALRYTPARGAILVAAREAGGEVVISVDDSGPGIESGNEGRIFERFWRGDTARPPGQDGAGLGLAIAKGLVEAHGGRIWAQSRTGGGTRVAFTLPVAASGKKETHVPGGQRRVVGSVGRPVER
jgi:signal transduction histidine kinase